MKELATERDIVAIGLLQTRRLIYFGHVSRKGNDRLSQLGYYYTVAHIESVKEVDQERLGLTTLDKTANL